MLYAKQLKIRHKEFLASIGLNHHDFLLKGEDADSYSFIDKKTNKSVDIRR